MKSTLITFLIGCLAGAGLFFFLKSEKKPDAVMAKILIYMKALEGKEQLVLARIQEKETFTQHLWDQTPLAVLLRSMFGPTIGFAQFDLECVADYHYYVDLNDPRWRFDSVGDTLLDVTAPPVQLLRPPGLNTPSLRLSIGQRSVFINERQKYDELVLSLTDTLTKIGTMHLKNTPAIHDTCRSRLEHVFGTFSNLVDARLRKAKVHFLEEQ